MRQVLLATASSALHLDKDTAPSCLYLVQNRQSLIQCPHDFPGQLAAFAAAVIVERLKDKHRLVRIKSRQEPPSLIRVNL